MAAKTGVKHLTVPQTIKAHALLSEHLEKVSEGLYRYAAGWDDETIAKLVEGSKSGVARVRTEAFGNIAGKLRPQKGNGHDDHYTELKYLIDKQGSDIAGEIEAVEDRLGNLLTKHNALVDALAAILPDADKLKVVV